MEEFQKHSEIIVNLWEIIWIISENDFINYWEKSIISKTKQKLLKLF